MQLTKHTFLARTLPGSLAAAFLLATSLPSPAAPITPEEARAIAKEAYTYGFPMV